MEESDRECVICNKYVNKRVVILTRHCNNNFESIIQAFVLQEL